MLMMLMIMMSRTMTVMMMVMMLVMMTVMMMVTMLTVFVRVNGAAAEKQRTNYLAPELHLVAFPGTMEIRTNQNKHELKINFQNITINHI